MRTRLRRMTEERNTYRTWMHAYRTWVEQFAAMVDELQVELIEAEADRQAWDNQHDRFPYATSTVRFTTESGAVYLLQDDGTSARLIRTQGPLNPWIRHGNGTWLDVVGTYAVVLGESAEFDLADGMTRRTSPVVGIDVVF